MSYVSDEKKSLAIELEVGKKYVLSEDVNCCFLKGDTVVVKELSNCSGWIQEHGEEKKYTYADKPVRALLFNKSGDLRIRSAWYSYQTRSMTLTKYQEVTSHIVEEWLAINEIII